MSDWSLELCVHAEKAEPDPPRNFVFRDFKHLLFRDLPIGLILAAVLLLGEKLKKMRMVSRQLFRPTRRRPQIILRVSPADAMPRN